MHSKLLTKRLLISVLVMEALVGGCALIFIASALWNKPLGPGLEMPAVANAQGMTPGANEGVSLAGSDGLPAANATPSASLLDQIVDLVNPAQGVENVVDGKSVKTLCGGPPVMTLLVVGSDERGHDYLYGLSDTMRLVRIDFVTPSVMVLDIPRDLWVDIPGISDHYGISMGKLNQAYFFGNPGMGYYDGPGEGPGLLARTLELNYGMTGIDHYLAMDRSTFIEIIDSIGGVDIQVNSKIDLNAGKDGANPDYVLEPGIHHLDGTLALKYASNRDESTFQRARYQNVILKAVQNKLLTPAMIPEIPGLITQFSNSVQTDLSANQVTELICIGGKLSGENTHIVEFPDKLFTAEHTYDPYRQVNTFTLGVDNQVMRDYFTAFMNGTWPQN